MSVDGRDTRKYPPHPLNTVELQKRASRYLRIGSEQVMKVSHKNATSGGLARRNQISGTA